MMISSDIYHIHIIVIMLNGSHPPDLPASLTLRTALSPGHLTQILSSNLRKALQGDHWKLGTPQPTKAIVSIVTKTPNFSSSNCKPQG